MTDFKVGDRVKHRARMDVGTVVALGGDGRVDVDWDTADIKPLWAQRANLTLVDRPVLAEGAKDEPPFTYLCGELSALLGERHKKYGPLNIAQAYGGPMNGLLVRMGDKFARLQHGLAEHKDESVIDSFMDLAGYSLIAVLVLRGEWPGVE